MPTLNPLQRQLQVVGWTDAEMRRVMRLAAQEAERLVASASNLRAAQLRLAASNKATWSAVGEVVQNGIGDGVFSALEYQSLFDERMFTRARIPSGYWAASQLATAQAGMEALISRKENGITLSQRVWRDSQTAQRGLNDAINVGLKLGKTPAEIARDVKKYLNPNVPGGASYAAMRLGRSETLNAYHATSVRKYKETPWIEKVRWNLSGSHPRPDECNEYAEGGNLKNGLWSPDQVPAKPHPNCLCYVEPVSMDLDTYAKKFQAGEFDDYIDQQMGCVSVA
jgi:hypothetical protein